MNQDKVGKFLASLRKENNLTQEDIAEKLNVNVKSVSRWENGRNLPDPSIMKEICKIYNVSINELFNGDKVKKSNKKEESETTVKNSKNNTSDDAKVGEKEAKINDINGKKNQSNRTEIVIGVIAAVVMVIAIIVYIIGKRKAENEK